MKLLCWGVCGVLATGCYNVDADFSAYCIDSGNCQCSGEGCCSLTTCGDGSLSCCGGLLCEGGQCTPPTASLAFSVTQVDFGQFPDLSRTPVMSVELTASGNIPATVEVTLVVVSGAPGDFNLDLSACPTTLQPGASCTVRISLTPVTAGPKQAILRTPSGPPCVVTGAFGFELSVNLSGNSLTSVQSNPPGLDCSGAVCSGYFPGGILVSLTVALPYGVIWGPPCGTSSGACALNLTADTQVTGTILPPLEVDVFAPGVPSGYVRIDPGGLTCTHGQCALDVSGALTLTAVAEPNVATNATVFQGWTGACAGSGIVCSLNVSGPTQTSVTLSDLNPVFTVGPVPLSTLGADGAGADAACNAAAPAGSSGSYIAWVATSTRNPGQLLATATGWAPQANTDYAVLPIAPSLSDITSARPWSGVGACPLGACSYVPPTPIMTGAKPDGSSLSPSDTCQDWTSTSGTAPVGSAGYLGYAWSVDLGAARIPCTGSALLACFGTAASGVVLTVPPSVLYYGNYGVMFLSSPWVPSGGESAADNHCQADAAAAGLPGTFVAGSLSLVSGGSTFFNFIRSDGALLGNYFVNGQQNPINVDAFGQGVVPTVLSDTYVWLEPTNSGPVTDCDGWTGGPGAIGTVTRFDLPETYPVTTAACTEAHRLFCLQTR